MFLERGDVDARRDVVARGDLFVVPGEEHCPSGRETAVLVQTPDTKHTGDVPSELRWRPGVALSAVTGVITTEQESTSPAFSRRARCAGTGHKVRTLADATGRNRGAGHRPAPSVLGANVTIPTRRR
jgi:hypothetical protein